MIGKNHSFGIPDMDSWYHLFGVSQAIPRILTLLSFSYQRLKSGSSGLQIFKATQLGSSLAELLCGIGIFSIAAMLVLNALLITRKSAESAKAAYDREATLQTVRFYLEKALLSTDSYRLEIPPKIHSNGIVSNSDGRPHAIMNLGATTRPKAGSDVITTTAAHPGYLIEVENPTSSTAFSDIMGCSPISFIEPLPQSFFAVAKDRLVFLVGTSTRVGTRCISINATASSHHSLKNQTEGNGKFLTLIPIESEFSLYVDTFDQLRLVSFRGERLLENQPVAPGVRALTLAVTGTIDSRSKFYRLSARVELVDGHFAEYNFHSRLGKDAIWNSLLWSL